MQKIGVRLRWTSEAMAVVGPFDRTRFRFHARALRDRPLGGLPQERGLVNLQFPTVTIDPLPAIARIEKLVNICYHVNGGWLLRRCPELAGIWRQKRQISKQTQFGRRP